MAEKLSDLRARTQSVEELGRVTAGVRAIAALRVEQAQTALKAIRAWAELIEDAMVDGLALAGPPIVLPATSPRPDAEALVVFGAEHGFTGAFSRHLLEAADAPYPAAGRPPLFIIGERTARRAREIGRTPTWSDAMPTQVRGTGEVAGRLADALLQRIARGETSTVEVVFARNTGAGRYEVQRKRLLPLDYALFGRPTRPRPGTFLPPKLLLQRLVDEYFYAGLLEATVESFASENGARLGTTQLAVQKIDDMLGALRREEQFTRQESITEELLELEVGARSTGRSR